LEFIKIYAALVFSDFVLVLECTIIGSEVPLIAPVSIITSSMSFDQVDQTLLLIVYFPVLTLKPLAPVFLVIALFAISLTDSFLKVSFTPSNLNNS